MRSNRHPVSRAIISIYQQHLTRYTPTCGRPGPSCSQLAAQVGVVAFLTGHMICAECSGGSSSGAARRSSGMGKTGKQQKRK
jgi:putative component of membrane protein insertase Oxa1/YidC/SpoIIIJ protein YidD